MNQYSILQTRKLVDEWQQIFVHEFLAIIQLDDIVQLGARHKSIMILINFLYRQLYRLKFIILGHYLENLLLAYRLQFNSRSIKFRLPEISINILRLVLIIRNVLLVHLLVHLVQNHCILLIINLRYIYHLILRFI